MNQRYWGWHVYTWARKHVGAWARKHARQIGTWACKQARHVGTLAREHVSTQGTLAREHVSTQGMWARKHARHVGTKRVSTQGTLAREHVSTLASDHIFSTQDTQFSRFVLIPKVQNKYVAYCICEIFLFYLLRTQFVNAYFSL